MGHRSRGERGLVLNLQSQEPQFEPICLTSIDRADERTILRRVCLRNGLSSDSPVISTERSCFAGILFHEVTAFVHATYFHGESPASLRDAAKSAARDVSSEGEGSRDTSGATVDSM